MAQFPALPLFTDAYLGDTTHLSTIEHGAYLLLLMTMWRAGGSLPADDKLLARYTRLNGQQWARIKPVIMEFFDEADGRITQGRLTDELEAVKRHSENQSRRVKSRWLKNKETADTGVSSGNYQTDTSPSHSLPTVEKSGVEVARARDHAPADTPAHMRGPDDPPAPMIFTPEQDALFDRVLKAVGQDRGAITTYWMPPQAIVEVIRFRGFGLTDDEIVAVAHEVRRSRNEPIRGPRGLETQMKLMAAAKQQPPFIPPGAQNAQPKRRLTAVARDASDINPIKAAARS